MFMKINQHWLRTCELVWCYLASHVYEYYLIMVAYICSSRIIHYTLTHNITHDMTHSRWLPNPTESLSRIVHPSPLLDCQVSLRRSAKLQLKNVKNISYRYPKLCWNHSHGTLNLLHNNCVSPNNVKRKRNTLRRTLGRDRDGIHFGQA